MLYSQSQQPGQNFSTSIMYGQQQATTSVECSKTERIVLFLSDLKERLLYQIEVAHGMFLDSLHENYSRIRKPLMFLCCLALLLTVRAARKSIGDTKISGLSTTSAKAPTPKPKAPSPPNVNSGTARNMATNTVGSTAGSSTAFGSSSTSTLGVGGSSTSSLGGTALGGSTSSFGGGSTTGSTSTLGGSSFGGSTSSLGGGTTAGSTSTLGGTGSTFGGASNSLASSPGSVPGGSSFGSSSTLGGSSSLGNSGTSTLGSGTGGSTGTASFSTAALCDTNCNNAGVQIVESNGPTDEFKSFGGSISFSGEIVALKSFENASPVEQFLSSQSGRGNGKVLVIDGGGSRRAAIFDESLASTASSGGWAGVIVIGCVRNLAQLSSSNLGVKALCASPRKVSSGGQSGQEASVQFGGVQFTTGHFVYADDDGILVSQQQISAGGSGGMGGGIPSSSFGDTRAMGSTSLPGGSSITSSTGFGSTPATGGFGGAASGGSSVGSGLGSVATSTTSTGGFGSSFGSSSSLGGSSSPMSGLSTSATSAVGTSGISNSGIGGGSSGGSLLSGYGSGSGSTGLAPPVTPGKPLPTSNKPAPAPASKPLNMPMSKTSTHSKKEKLKLAMAKFKERVMKFIPTGKKAKYASVMAISLFCAAAYVLVKKRRQEQGMYGGYGGGQSIYGSSSRAMYGWQHV